MCRGLAGISLLCRVSYRNTICPAICPAQQMHLPIDRSFVRSTSDPSDQINTVDDVSTTLGKHGRRLGHQTSRKRLPATKVDHMSWLGRAGTGVCHVVGISEPMPKYPFMPILRGFYMGSMELQLRCVLTRSNRRPRGGCANSFVGRFRYHFPYACGIRVRIKLTVGPYPSHPWSIRFAIYLRGVRLGRYDKD